MPNSKHSFKGMFKDKPVLIKSTIRLEGWQVCKAIRNDITFSPEF